MADYDDPASADLVREVKQKAREEEEQREPLTRAWLTVVGTLALFGVTFWMEWSGISLALGQLFPTLSDGSSEIDATGVMALLSVFGIVVGELLLSKASKSWSERTWRWLMRAGMIALLLFVLSTMMLLPTSIWQANAPSDTGDGSAGLSATAYLAFSLMLSSIFPLAMLVNFFLFDALQSALGKIERTKELDKQVRRKRDLLDRREATLASLREVEQRQIATPTDEDVTDEYCAHASADIGQVAGELKGVITLREAAENGNPDAPLVATDDDFLNHLPIEKLRAQFDYLSTFTPAAIRQRIASKEA